MKCQVSSPRHSIMDSTMALGAGSSQLGIPLHRARNSHSATKASNVSVGPTIAATVDLRGSRSSTSSDSFVRLAGHAATVPP